MPGWIEGRYAPGRIAGDGFSQYGFIADRGPWQ
jgi:hypothetical protein